MRSRAPLVWVLVLVTGVTACDLKRSPTGTGSNPLSGVVVSPDSVMLDPQQSYQFQAFGRGAAGDTVPVNANWSATAGTITSSGMYTADTSENDAAVTASIPLSGVTLTGTSLVKKRRVTAVLLTPSSTTLTVNTVMQFTARGIRNSGDTVSINANYSAAGGTITSGGLFTAGSVPGTYRVIASDNPHRLADTSVVTVTSAPVALVTLTPNPASLSVGGTAQLSATLTDLAGNVLTGRSITWSSNASGVATVSSTGLVSGVSAGNATITATSEGIDGTAAIIVSLAPVASVTVTPVSVTVGAGSTAQLTAVTKDAAGNVLTGRVVTWSSNAFGTATVSANGLVTGVAAGSATITATSEGRSGSVVVTVNAALPAPVASVSVSPNPAGVQVGATVQLTATLRDSAGNVLTGRSVTWTSATLGVATVSATGLVTGVVAGSVTITAASEGKSGTDQVTVSAIPPAPVASVSVSPNPAGVQVGVTVQLTATLRDAAGNVLTGRTITWSSNATGVATVSASGLVTGVSGGNATITATSEGKSGTAAVTITAVPVASVTVTPNPSGLRVGGTVQLTAVTKDSAGNILTGRAVTWSSNAIGVATVSATGRVTGVAAGSATIAAMSEGKSGTAAITVTLAPVATVTVSPNPASVVVAGTVQLAATLKDSAGATLTGRVVTWASSAPAVATVSANGLVSGLAVGTATITATSETKSGTSNLTVTVVGTGCAAACRYVAVTGNDGNAGTKTAPWRTIQHAADVMNAGDTVIVNDGVYTGGANVVLITRSGTAAAWMVFRAANRWGAIVDGQNNSSTTGFEINGNYIRVEGFEVRNTSRYAMETYGGREDIAGNHDIILSQNHLHDVGHICTGTTGGIVGVSAYSDNLTIERNVIHDIGRLGPGEQGCVEPNANWQNHDHGIYNGVGNNVVVRNNVFYNFTHGWAIQRYNGGGSVTSGLTIVNNTFGFPNPWRDAQIIIATPTNNVVVANNLFYQPTTAGVWFDGSNGGTLVGNVSTNSIQTGGSGLTMSGNMQNTDPLFVNATGFNFRLTAGSPARGLGVATWCPAVDFDGVARTGACSAGAYQN
jgi:uncharacterized protein YjdB